MTVRFDDIHHLDNIDTQSQRVVGAEFDEVLYADDTIVYGTKEDEAEKRVSAIAKEGKKYGLKLNKDKCEYVNFGLGRQLQFEDGTDIPKREVVKYLGCHINDKGDMGKEISSRIRDCYMVMHKLRLFWSRCPLSKLFKMLFDLKAFIPVSLSLSDTLDYQCLLNLQCSQENLNLPS